MRRPGLARDATVGATGSLIAAGVLFLGSKLDLTTLTVDVALAALVAVLSGLLTYLVWTRPHGILGRAEFMKANLGAMRREVDNFKSGQASRVSTTRFSSWELRELSEVRASLRVQNDRAAREGVRLLRLHNLRTDDDRAKLLWELREYAGHANASIRVFFDVDPRLLPELIVTTRYAAIGPPDSDGVMRHGLAYRSSNVVDAVNEYYGSLWSAAMPALESGVVVPGIQEALHAWTARRR